VTQALGADCPTTGRHGVRTRTVRRPGRQGALRGHHDVRGVL